MHAFILCFKLNVKPKQFKLQGIKLLNIFL